MNKLSFTLLFIILMSASLQAQEASEAEGEGEIFRHHAIGMEISHGFISQGVANDGRKWRIVPSWELSYSYSFNPKWFLGLSVHIILEDFQVEKYGRSNNEEGTLDRNKPVAPSINAGYRATKHSSFAIGFGGEFAEGENYFLTRIVYEWTTEINEKWELAIPLTYDIRWDAYDIWDIGIGVVRRF